MLTQFCDKILNSSCATCNKPMSVSSSFSLPFVFIKYSTILSRLVTALEYHKYTSYQKLSIIPKLNHPIVAINQVGWLVGWLAGSLAGWLSGWLVDWLLTGWLVDWLLTG
uniref:Uncharacterized protein n=1 Tax=Glossina brevipalpis TaxID=37001 RepID=A0A1A9WT41_9MUSC